MKIFYSCHGRVNLSYRNSPANAFAIKPSYNIPGSGLLVTVSVYTVHYWDHMHCCVCPDFMIHACRPACTHTSSRHGVYV